MEEIIIKDNGNNILLYLDNHNYYGYVFSKDNTIDNVDASVFKYFDLFKLSPDCTKLGTKDGYEIFLDNETGLKHYLHNGIDDIEMLWKNNGTSSILYVDYHENLQNSKFERKIFNFKTAVIGCTLMGVILTTTAHTYTLLKPPESISKIIYAEYHNFELKDVQDLIYSSSNLTEEEKNFLYNEEFFSDVLNTIEDYNYRKFTLKRALTDVSIKKYDSEHSPYKGYLGYYNKADYNTIHIQDYTSLNKANANTLAHEFIHLWQDDNCYFSLIEESCAEIIASEYYPEFKHNAYIDQVKTIKILMEIIGPEPIWYYNFTSDFSKIEEKVKPYLTKKEYDEFLNDLYYNNGKNEINKEKIESLNNIMPTLYKNIYGEDINDNEIISLIKNNKELTRYYFNDRLINDENSYYMDYQYEDISLEDAIKNGIVLVQATRKRELNREEALEYTKNEQYAIERKIDYSSSIEIDKETFRGNKIYITGTIDGTYYEEADIDELYSCGYLNVIYIIKENKILTYEEYISDETKQYEIKYLADNNTIVGSNQVTALIGKKIYIPSINENNNNSIQKKKK